MKKLLVLLLAGMLIVSSMAGCGGSGDSGTDSGGSDQNAASDTIIFAQGADPRGLDPALSDDGESAKICSNIYEGLLRYEDDSTELLPSLATQWEISPDGLTYTFKLRDDVKFQDGTDFNAEAVKFNYERQMAGNATEDMSYAGFVFGFVEKVEAVDTYTVKVTLTQASTPFLANLAMVFGAPIVSPKALQDNNNNVAEAPCGTGPYSFVKWSKGESVVLVRNDEYWGEKAKVKNIIFRFIPDNSARVLALNNGEVDIIDGIDATVVDQIQKGGMEIMEVPGMNINYMAYNVTAPLFQDAAARKAFSQAINVPELTESLYQGYAELATTILPTFMPGYSTDVTQVAYDPEAAKTGLAAAGITKVHMITYSNPRPYNTATGQSLATAIQGYLQKVGVECVIDVYDWTTYKQKATAGDYDICFYGWTGDNGDPDNFMTLLSDEDPSMNVARWQDDAYKKMIAEAAATPNGDERNAQYAAMEQYVADQAIWLPISHSKVLVGYNPKVTGFIYHMTNDVLFVNATKQ